MLSRMTRKQIIELLETVREGIVCPNMNERAAMLDECIAALSISQNICKKELVAERFAQYKDTMDTMTAALGQMKESPAEEITVLSLQLLDWLLGELKNEKVKKEIVFLPYKASMWDSLESIWRAAAEDSEHCNAYVVPIPYADLTKEHTVKEWHCEIELFPKDVPVLDFRQVDLEKMHPDVIFIHNPYDYANYVTSVDSHYYSSELKKYTDKLVYVPYFVIGNNLPPHFAQAPGVVNADYVIVESEEIKEQYERYYPGGNPPEGKFLALGSPKYDKVLSAKREDYELPERWQKLLNGRKSILYNTGVSAVLQNRDTYLKKVRSVFDTFKQRDDVVLWWRPHPLLEATFDSMVPEQAEEYRQLREEYIQAGWGIYDDSPELERAITWTDAYYGDQSSVVWMYQATGKRVLIQDLLPPIDTLINCAVWPCCFVANSQNLWMVHGKLNLLMKYDLDTFQCVRIERIPCEKTVQESLFCRMFIVGDNLILIPALARNIWVYNINSKKFFTVDLPKVLTRHDEIIFTDAFLFGTYIFAVPSNEPCLLKINVKTFTSELFCYWNLEKYNSGVSSATIYSKGIIYTSLHGTNRIMVYDLREESIEYIDLPNEDLTISCICSVSNCIFVTDNIHKKTYLYKNDKLVELLVEKEAYPLKLLSVDDKSFLLDSVNSGGCLLYDIDTEFKLDLSSPTQKEKGVLQYSYKHGLVYTTDWAKYYFDRNINKLCIFSLGNTEQQEELFLPAKEKFYQIIINDGVVLRDFIKQIDTGISGNVLILKNYCGHKVYRVSVR